jgi:hypothetical protein
MAESRRRRMSRHISLVLLGALPAIAGCGGCRERTKVVEEVTEVPPPQGPEQLIGGPFVGWWHATHPPIVVRKTVRDSTATSGHPRRRGGIFFIPIGGRSRYLSGGNPPRSNAPVVRGGFGSSGHGAVGG